MVYLLFSLFLNSSHLFRSKLDFWKKVYILFLYIILTVVFPLFNFFKLKKICIFKVTLEGFDFGTLYKLFSENFVRNQYFFVARKKDPVIFDCGASIGDSVLYFKFLYPHSRIFAFEPDPVTFEMLVKNIKNNNLKNISIHNIALADKAGYRPLYIGNSIGALQMSLTSKRLSGNTTKVRTAKLISFSRLVDKIDLLKMDIEGAEFSLLKQLVTSGEIKKVQQIIVEYHHHIGVEKENLGEFILLLEKSGFRCQIDSSFIPLYQKDKFQDILILAYKR